MQSGDICHFIAFYLPILLLYIREKSSNFPKEDDSQELPIEIKMCDDFLSFSSFISDCCHQLTGQAVHK